MFKVNTFYDNLWYYQTLVHPSGELEAAKTIVANEPVIKHILDTQFRKLITENNHKLKLQAYITIKYTVCEDTTDNLHHINNENVHLIEDDTKDTRYFNSQTATLLSSHMLSGYINDILNEFSEDLIDAKGSNYALLSFEKLQIKTSRSKPTTGGSYIELPDFIKGKRACVNIINTDEKCFLWALLAYKHYDKYAKLGCKNKANTYKKHIQDIIEPEGVTYPLNIDFIPQFEELNNLKINIFEISENKKVNILYNSYEKYKNVVSLLLIENENNAHYVWIKDINRLKI